MVSTADVNATLHQNLALAGRPGKRWFMVFHSPSDGIAQEHRRRIPADKKPRNYEIRYLPLSEHYQLTARCTVRSDFPQAAPLLAELSSVSLLQHGLYYLPVNTNCWRGLAWTAEDASPDAPAVLFSSNGGTIPSGLPGR